MARSFSMMYPFYRTIRRSEIRVQGAELTLLDVALHQRMPKKPGASRLAASRKWNGGTDHLRRCLKFFRQKLLFKITAGDTG